MGLSLRWGFNDGVLRRLKIIGFLGEALGIVEKEFIDVESAIFFASCLLLCSVCLSRNKKRKVKAGSLCPDSKVVKTLTRCRSSCFHRLISVYGRNPRLPICIKISHEK